MFTALLRSHQRIRKTLRQLRDDRASRDETLNVLFDMLEEHQRCEQQFFSSLTTSAATLKRADEVRVAIRLSFFRLVTTDLESSHFERFLLDVSLAVRSQLALHAAMAGTAQVANLSIEYQLRIAKGVSPAALQKAHPRHRSDTFGRVGTSTYS